MTIQLRRFTLLILILALGMLFGCDNTAPQTALSPIVPFESMEASRAFSMEALLEDLNQLVGIIKRTHPKPYAFQSPEAFEALVGSVREQLHEGMSEDAFYRAISPLIPSIGCNHSYLSPSPELEGLMEAEGAYLPVEIRILESRLWVTDAFGYPGIQSGSEVTGINGIAANAHIDQLYRTTSGQGLGTAYKRSRINALFSLYFLQQVGQSAVYTLDLVDPAGQRQTVMAKGISFADYLSHARRRLPDQSNAFRILEGGVGVLKIGGFQDSSNRYASFVEDSFAALQDKAVKRLILDLRGNGGGAPSEAVLLLKHLLHEPVRYFATSYGGYETLSQPIEPSDPVFEGDVYVLIDGGGSSTTGHLVSLIKYHQLGTLVGEELGSTYTCNDFSEDKVLNHTGIRIRIATKTFETAVTGIPKESGIQPDVAVMVTAMDIVKGRDPMMEAALSLIRQ